MASSITVTPLAGSLGAEVTGVDLRTIEETGARRVLATHGNTEAIVQLLRERGVDAEPLRTAFGDEH